MKKKKMIATAIEQSKHLIELGLDPKTADMFWAHFNGEDRLYVRDMKYQLVHKYQVCVAWSLSALLEVMRKLNATITLQIIGNSTFLRIKDNEFLWQKDIHVKNPMDAVYGAMLWLLEQGLIKKGGQYDSNVHSN